MGATAALVYQKWVAYVSESVIRVFGGDLDHIFRENQKNPDLIAFGQPFDKSYAPHFWSEDQTFV